VIGLSDGGVFEIEMLQYMYVRRLTGGWKMLVVRGDRTCRHCTIAVGDKTLDVRKSNWTWCVTPSTDERNGGWVAARAD